MRTSALGAYRIDLLVTLGKDDRLCIGHQVGLEQNGVGIQERHRQLIARVGGETTRSTPIATHDIEVVAPLTGRSKDNLLAVGAPHRIGVLSCIGGKLGCLATAHGYGKDITFIGEGDDGAIGRDGVMTHPQGIFLGNGTHSYQECQKQTLYFHIFIFSYFNRNLILWGPHATPRVRRWYNR